MSVEPSHITPINSHADVSKKTGCTDVLLRCTSVRRCITWTFSMDNSTINAPSAVFPPRSGSPLYGAAQPGRLPAALQLAPHPLDPRLRVLPFFCSALIRSSSSAGHHSGNNWPTIRVLFAHRSTRGVSPCLQAPGTRGEF